MNKADLRKVSIKSSLVVNRAGYVPQQYVGYFHKWIEHRDQNREPLGEAALIELENGEVKIFLLKDFNVKFIK